MGESELFNFTDENIPKIENTKPFTPPEKLTPDIDIDDLANQTLSEELVSKLKQKIKNKEFTDEQSNRIKEILTSKLNEPIQAKPDVVVNPYQSFMQNPYFNLSNMPNMPPNMSNMSNIPGSMSGVIPNMPNMPNMSNMPNLSNMSGVMPNMSNMPNMPNISNMPGVMQNMHTSIPTNMPLINPLNNNINNSSGMPRPMMYGGTISVNHLGEGKMNTQKYRTKPCRNYHTSTGCMRGNNCHFIHDPNYAGKDIPNFNLFNYRDDESEKPKPEVQNPMFNPRPPLPMNMMPRPYYINPHFNPYMMNPNMMPRPGMQGMPGQNDGDNK
jgi:hypothetical protein